MASKGVHEISFGQPFNPRYEACGFHPGEIISKRHELTDGQKLLYDRMARWARAKNGRRDNERAGEVWRSHENMARELGKSARQIRRDLNILESAGLIKHRSRDGRRSNTYVFLFHPWLERESVPNQVRDGAERSPVSARVDAAEPECPIAAGPPRPLKLDLSGHLRPANQKTSNQGVESSYTRQGYARLRVQRRASQSETMKEPSFELTQRTSATARWWTPEDLAEAAGILKQFAGEALCLVQPFDPATVLAIIPNLQSITPEPKGSKRSVPSADWTQQQFAGSPPGGSSIPLPHPRPGQHLLP